MERNQSFENSLRCLQHPISLLSIALLLLNDHVFKVISPSWLTGKLSDFAGLFFFPFIVSAGLSLLLAKSNFKARDIGKLAFGFVAIWFFLLKTFPIVNSLTSQLSSFVVGFPTQFILDWTDIVGLTAMIPAWKLWNQPPQGKLSKRAYISLSAGLLACLATSPVPPPFDTVTALADRDGILYAQGDDFYFIAQSTDNGDNWVWIFPSKNERKDIEALLYGHRLPAQACDPAEQRTCYRIDGGDKVLTSNEDGEIWQTAWEIPPERRDFVLRVSVNMATHDLIIVEQSGLRYLFVAMGSNGILRRQLPDGEWERIGIEEAQPTPFYAPDMMTAISIVGKEMLIWVGVAFVVLLITNIAIWNRLPRGKSFIDLTDWLSLTILLAIAFVLAEAAIAFAAFLLLIAVDFVLHFMSASLLEFLSRLAVVIAVIIPFIWLLMRTNKWILKTTPDKSVGPRIIIYSALTVFGVLLIGALPWPLWALGIISRYQSAQTISIIISVFITAIGCYQISKAK